MMNTQMNNTASWEDRVFARALKYSFTVSRGGIMRARILLLLLRQPSNPLVIAKALSIDYKTAAHHLEKLLQQNLVVKNGNAYGATYAPTFTPSQHEAFIRLTREMGESL
jgi:predicted transcriptional regulator